MPPKKPTAVPKKATPAKKTGGNGGKKTTPVSSQKKGATSSKDAKDVTDKLAKLSTTDEQPKPVIIEIELKDLADVLKDDDGKIKSTGKWPMIVDSGGRAAVFLRYQGGNCLDAISPSDMQAETIRKRLIGSIRYGNNFTIDFGDSDMFNSCRDRFEEIHKGLMNDVLDKSILEKYEHLITDADGPDYEKDKFLPHVTCNFQFIILSKIDPSQDIRNKFCIIKIKE
ncbi:IQ motif and ankyrin repeat domain-containing protein 1-like [Lytechinus variegatus]|uniref:IQ motif and ankyrin repeat domain-containing protein 1-like n=1 Tax=Lytechinus variegatus TaxID=7654 RepID=UPI001BB1AA0F|nr:IQ motif and ankyrin repeat domain-containing protein 1-like [Lytechinus variegatus]